MGDRETEVRIHQLLAQGRGPMVLATVVGAEGSTPGKPGFKLLLLPDCRTVGTVGGGKLEQLVLEEARAILTGGGGARLKSYDLTETATGMWCGGRQTIFLEPVLPAAALWIFGFGHVGSEVRRLAAGVGFATKVLHDKPEEAADLLPFDWARLEPFPEVAPRDFVLLLTMDAERELSIVRRLAAAPPRYIGVVGSRAKGGKIRTKLEEEGHAAVARALRIPVGLAIGAETAEEIAVSIVAELVRERSGAAAQVEERT